MCTFVVLHLPSTRDSSELKFFQLDGEKGVDPVSEHGLSMLAVLGVSLPSVCLRYGLISLCKVIQRS